MTKLIITFILLGHFYSSTSQTHRYLSHKNYNNDGKVLHPTLNRDNSKFAVTNVYMRENGATANSTVLNLQTGRLEANFTGQLLIFLGNDLIMADMKTNKYSYFNPSTGNKEELIVPKGFWIMKGYDKYIVASNAQAKKSVFLDKNGTHSVLKKFDLGFVKISKDGTKAYGHRAYFDDSIFIYDVESGRLIKTIKTINHEEFEMLTNGKFIVSSLIDKSLSIIDENGTPLSKLSDASMTFQLNDMETELVNVDVHGNIRLWDLDSGKILARITDVFLNDGNSNIAIGAPQKVSGGKFYLIPYQNGIVSLLSSSEQKIIANLFFDGLDWAVIAKDGRFDGTPGAFDKLEWQEYTGKELVRTTPIETSFDKYYTPQLLYTILRGEESSVDLNTVNIDEDIKFVPSLELIDVNGMPVSSRPGDVVKFESNQRNIIVRVKATANADHIKEVRLFNNGKLVGIEPRNQSANYSFSTNLNSMNGNTNSLYLVASTTDGLDSEKFKIAISYSGRDNSKPKLYALVVGINKYQNPRYELNYALTDASAIKSQLENGRSILFESVAVKTLFENDATKANIMKAFSDLSKVVKEQDVFIFYYAGHGTMSESPANEFFIVPFDVTQLYGNETLLREKALSSAEIKNLSMAINAQKQIFILDACHSAAALNTSVTRGAAEERAIGQLARSTGTFWLTAAGSEQFATEFAQLGHGVFTYSLLEALQGKDAATIMDGSLTIRELSTYVEQRVPELSSQYKGATQYPASFSFGNDFPIILFDKQ
jgi:WD40 repeat protein